VGEKEAGGKNGGKKSKGPPDERFAFNRNLPRKKDGRLLKKSTTTGEKGGG